MPRQTPKLIDDFLVPALDDGTYGDDLHWVDPVEGVFRIKWMHKNSAQWNVDDAVVFIDWDRLKGRYANDAEYFMRSKQRFRSALQKLGVAKMGSDTNGYMTYKFNNEQLRTSAQNKENERPITDNERDETQSESSEPENDFHNAARTLMELHVNSRPNMHYLKALHNNVKQDNVEEQQEVIQKEEAVWTQSNILEYAITQPCGQADFMALVEAPFMFTVPTYHDI